VVQNSKNQNLEEISNTSYLPIKQQTIANNENTFSDYIHKGASALGQTALGPAIIAPFIGMGYDMYTLIFTQNYETMGTGLVAGTLIMGTLFIGGTLTGAALGTIYGAGKKLTEEVTACYEKITNIDITKKHKQDQYCLKMFD
jgi:hypothetical protein